MQIIVKLTTDCNLACSYCSEGDQPSCHLSPQLFAKMVDDLPELLNELELKRLDILFHGGEPMLYGHEELRHLVKLARSRLNDIELTFSMQTNGTLIDNDWIDFFRQENISVGISLDGYPELHDSKRRTKHGKATAAFIMDNIAKMRAAGLRVGTLMVLDSAEAVDVDKLLDLIVEHDLQAKIHPVIACGRAEGRKDEQTVCENYLLLMKSLLPKALKLATPIKIQPLDEIMNTILGLAPLRECSFNGSCGKDLICVYADGEVGFCGRDNRTRSLVYGNLANTTLLELYNSDNAKQIRDRQAYLRNHSCQNCRDWDFCHGGCAFEAVNAFGSLTAKYPHCAMRKKLVHYLKTDGIKLLKEAMVQEKIKFRHSMQLKRKMLGEIDRIALPVNTNNFSEENHA